MNSKVVSKKRKEKAQLTWMSLILKCQLLPPNLLNAR